MKFISALLIAIFPLVSLADVVVPVDKVENSVNIRLEPDAASDVVGRLEKGESIPLVDSVEGWYEVQLEGDATGYISADWAEVRTEELIDEAANEPIEEAAVTALVEMAEEAAAESTVEPLDDEVVVEDIEDVVEKVVEEPVVEPVVEEETDETAVVEDVTVAEPATAPDHAPTVVTGPAGPPGPAGLPGAANLKGSKNFLVKFKDETEGGNSQIFDIGNRVGIGTTDPKQRLEVNGSIQIHEQNSSVAGLMITQSSGETGYIMHNRASTLTIGSGSEDRISIDRDGNVGIAVTRPSYPLEMASGAHVTTGGVWTNSSSRDKKENISELSAEEARAAVMQLEPVLFNYRAERSEEYVGFIAEDVPELLASADRKSLSTMDIVAVLTKVVQQQQRTIEALEARLDAQ